MNEIPRRIDILRNTVPEMKIREAVDAVEMMGAHPKLTESVVLLNRAREALADYIDMPRCNWGIRVNNQIISCKVCQRVQTTWNINDPCCGPKNISLRNGENDNEKA